MNYFAHIHTAEALLKAYRQLSFIHHPDKGGDMATFQEMKNQYEKAIKRLDQVENKKSGIGWEITEKMIFDTNGQPIDGYKAIYNDYTGKLLNIAKATYTPTRNERFEEMVYRLSKISGSNEIDFVSFDGGKKVLAYIKTEPTEVAGFKYKKILLVGNAHDSSSALFVGTTNVMVRCENQFTQKNQQMKAYHTTGHEIQLKNLEAIFKSHHQLAAALDKNLNTLATKKITAADKNQFVRHCLGLPASIPLDEISTRKRNQMDTLNDAIVREVRAVGQSALGLFEGATYYTSHILKSKQAAYGSVFGTQAEINNKAMSYCMSL